MTPSPSALIAAADRLSSDVATHKAAIGHHKRRLRQAKAALVNIESALQRLGVRLVTVPTRTGEGAPLHGHHDRHDP